MSSGTKFLLRMARAPCLPWPEQATSWGGPLLLPCPATAPGALETASPMVISRIGPIPNIVSITCHRVCTQGLHTAQGKRKMCRQLSQLREKRNRVCMHSRSRTLKQYTDLFTCMGKMAVITLGEFLMAEADELINRQSNCTGTYAVALM